MGGGTLPPALLDARLGLKTAADGVEPTDGHAGQQFVQTLGEVGELSGR
jgi:hypothetical protein